MWGSDLNRILNKFRKVERIPLLSVNFSSCSTNWVNLPPTGKSGRSRTGSGWRWTSEFVKNEACLEEGNCPISTSLSIIPLLDKYDCVWLRPVQLRLVRPGRFSWLLQFLRPKEPDKSLLLLYVISNRGICQGPLLLDLNSFFALGNSLILL